MKEYSAEMVKAETVWQRASSPRPMWGTFTWSWDQKLGNRGVIEWMVVLMGGIGDSYDGSKHTARSATVGKGKTEGS